MSSRKIAMEVEERVFDPRAPRFPVAEIAKQVGVCDRVIYEAMAKNELGFVKLGNAFLSTQQDIDQYILARYQPAKRA